MVSLVPGSYRPSTVILPDTVEHALAFLLIGALSGVAARDVVRLTWIAFTLTAYAGVCGCLETLVPGRTASVEDAWPAPWGP